MVILRNILAVLIGCFIGSIVNMMTLETGMKLIPPPTGFDYTTIEGLSAAMQHFDFSHFVSPFLAHALGTLVGAFLAALIAGSRRINLALLIGVFFLLGGAYMVYSLPSPMWFNILDLGLAYIPMAYIGAKIAIKIRPQR